LYYNNDGDPSASRGKDSAWLSRFKSIGWRGEFPSRTTFIVQGIKGDTAVGSSQDGHGLLILDYWSYFALVSQTFGEHRISARFDRMFTDSARGRNLFPSGQSARAWTLAYLWDIDSRWEIGAELVQLSGRLDQRVAAGLPVSATERNVQLAVRWSL
jgi:membrane-associated phospholipid phosphatase